MMPRASGSGSSMADEEIAEIANIEDIAEIANIEDIAGTEERADREASRNRMPSGLQARTSE